MTGARGTAGAVAALLAAVGLAGCSLNPPPVRVEGDREAVERLAGEWEGEYVNPEAGRVGSIVFRLEAGRDTAYGDVLMIARDPRDVGPSTHIDGPGDMGPRAMTLDIEFVRCSGDRVRGLLAPYTDPDCGCVVVTEFVGTLEGDRIRGTFTTWRSGGERRAAGSWEVERVR